MNDGVKITYKSRTVKVNDEDMRRLVAANLSTLDMAFSDDSRQGALIKEQVKKNIWGWFKSLEDIDDEQ